MRPTRKVQKPEVLMSVMQGKPDHKTSPHRATARAVARGDSFSDATYLPKARSASSSSLRRKRPAPVDADSEEDGTQDTPATSTSANHNKYCHFCQHVKVRASSMLACENLECCRRFCEHCLLTHLNEDVDPMSSPAWSIVNGQPFWHCPICRKKCCCSVATCEESHRHCKAYRYRRRRAELATKRMTAMANHTTSEKRGKKGVASRAAPKAAVSTPPVARPSLSFGFVRTHDKAAHLSSIESPPLRSAPMSLVPAPLSNRPRREVTLKQRNAAAEQEHGEEEHIEEDDEINTPGAESDVPTAPPSRNGPVELPFHEVEQTAAQNYEQSAAEKDVWTDEVDAVVSLPTHLHYRSDGEEDHDEEMLGGIYGHMTQIARNGSIILAGDMYEHHDEMMLGDDISSSVELDEARWLRRTYETVYNPAARQRALQALTGGDPAKGRECGRDPCVSLPHCDKTTLSPTAHTPFATNVATWKTQATIKAPTGGCDDLACFMQPAPKAPWTDGQARKCTVMYDFV